MQIISQFISGLSARRVKRTYFEAWPHPTFRASNFFGLFGTRWCWRCIQLLILGWGRVKAARMALLCVCVCVCPYTLCGFSFCIPPFALSFPLWLSSSHSLCCSISCDSWWHVVTCQCESRNIQRKENLHFAPVQAKATRVQTHLGFEREKMNEFVFDYAKHLLGTWSTELW